MQSESSVEIDRPIDEVFRLTHENMPDWSIIVVKDEALDDGPTQVGTRFRTVTEEHGKRMEFQGVVTKYEPPRLHTVELTGDSFDIEAEYTFEDLGGRTRMTQRSDVTGKGFFGLFLFLCGWMMKMSSCKAGENELNSLKRFCEEYPGSAPD